MYGEVEDNGTTRPSGRAEESGGVVPPRRALGRASTVAAGK